MAAKRTPKAASDEIDDLFEGITDQAAPKRGATPSGTAKPATKQNDDILAELESELSGAPSRPMTPRIKDVTASAKAPAAKRAGTPNTERTSEDRPAGSVSRKSGESTRSFHNSFTPSASSASEVHEAEKQPAAAKEPVQTEAVSSGGGWWGGLLSTATATASAAMKQAEVAYKEIQQNEEAKKWADQVRGNVGALRGLGDNIAHRALPTFTNILHTLAPPISSHERLLIHITHDLVGYPSLDPLIHGVFSRVMAQVEGGNLLVIQRGHENAMKSPSSTDKSGMSGFFGGTLPGQSSSAGWRDGPWWRDVGSPRDMGLVKGLNEGTKLCRASAEGYSTEFFSYHGGIAEARHRATEPVSESNPRRSSDLFLAVQAIDVGDGYQALFAGSSASTAEKDASTSTSTLGDDGTDKDSELVCFAVYILDPVHNISFSTISQTLPAKWIRWLDAPGPLTPNTSAEDEHGAGEDERLPEEIREIIESGGIDPREWVAEWIEETISLAAGVVAQRYVARRMGVGEGSIGKGKRKMEDVIQDGGGEMARAGLI